MKKLSVLALMSFLIFCSSNLIAQTVYITKSGTKYHADGCRYLSTSKTAIELADAISKGYQPCSVCKPPAQVNSKAKTTENKQATTTTNSTTPTTKSVSTSTGTTSSGKTLITGPKGGTYYINKNGNKTYVKKK